MIIQKILQAFAPLINKQGVFKYFICKSINIREYKAVSENLHNHMIPVKE